MTKVKLSNVRDLEKDGLFYKSIQIIYEQGASAMDVTINTANTTEMKELSKKLESAIRRALK